MRDAESLLDQVVAFGGTGLTAGEAAEVLGIVDQDVYFELIDIVADQDVPRGLDLVDRVFRHGHDLEEIILGVLEHLRNLLVVKAAPEADALLGAAALAFDRYREQRSDSIRKTCSGCLNWPRRWNSPSSKAHFPGCSSRRASSA